jgi:hypothetical protein
MILNGSVAFLGLMLVVSGILKSMGILNDIQLYFGDVIYTFRSPNSITYNLLVNFIGGGAMLFHALKTWEFKRKKIYKQETTILDLNPASIEHNGLSKPAFWTGLITLVLCLWLAIRAFVMLSSFEGNIVRALPGFIISFLFFASYSFFPFLLVSKNLALHNEINKKNYDKAKEEERKLIRKERGSRRR